MNPARFYVANLGADIARCIAALQRHDEVRYQASLDRAWRTLVALRATRRLEAYEEGVLLVRGLEYAREDGALDEYLANTNRFVASLV